MDEIDWSKFHDWILDQITVEWDTGTVKINVFLENKCEIVIKHFVDITIPRRLPWGMSHYINSITTNKNLDNWIMEIELQSGDLISIEGVNFSLITQE